MARAREVNEEWLLDGEPAGHLARVVAAAGAFQGYRVEVPVDSTVRITRPGSGIALPVVAILFAIPTAGLSLVAWLLVSRTPRTLSVLVEGDGTGGTRMHLRGYADPVLMRELQSVARGPGR